MRSVCAVEKDGSFVVWVQHACQFAILGVIDALARLMVNVALTFVGVNVWLKCAELQWIFVDGWLTLCVHPS